MLADYCIEINDSDLVDKTFASIGKLWLCLPSTESESVHTMLAVRQVKAINYGRFSILELN